MHKCENDLYHGDEGRDWSIPVSAATRARRKAAHAAACRAQMEKNPAYIAGKQQRAYEMQCALVAKLWN